MSTIYVVKISQKHYKLCDADIVWELYLGYICLWITQSLTHTVTSYSHIQAKGNLLPLGF